MPTPSSSCAAPIRICYIGQVNYWLTDEQRTRLTGSVYAGPNAIFAAPGLAGNYVTMVELRLQQNWTERFTQVIQNNMGWDANTPVGTGSWYGLYTIGIFHLTTEFDINCRAEWFDDVKGTRTGINTNYAEVTLGSTGTPASAWSSARRSAATSPARRPSASTAPITISQLTGGISFLVKF